jgi:hypothetical protein
LCFSPRFTFALGKDHPQVLVARIDLADVLRAEHRYTDSEKLGRTTLAAMQKAFEPHDARLVQALRNRARLLSETHRQAEAAALLKGIGPVPPPQ